MLEAWGELSVECKAVGCMQTDFAPSCFVVSLLCKTNISHYILIALACLLVAWRLSVHRHVLLFPCFGSVRSLCMFGSLGILVFVVCVVFVYVWYGWYVLVFVVSLVLLVFVVCLVLLVFVLFVVCFGSFGTLCVSVYVRHV